MLISSAQNALLNKGYFPHSHSVHGSDRGVADLCNKWVHRSRLRFYSDWHVCQGKNSHLNNAGIMAEKDVKGNRGSEIRRKYCVIS